MDISVEILATSLSISKENLRYKIKTWWTHVDVEENQKLTHLPSLPMIQPFYDMNGGRETTVFVEMWYKNDELFPVGSMRFLGLAKQRVDNQLRNPAWNPTVEFLEIYDPIEDITRGRLLLKIDAKFIPSPSLIKVNENEGPTQQQHQISSYFNNSMSESVITVISSKQDDEDDKNEQNHVVKQKSSSSRTSSLVQTSPPTKFKSVTVQTKDEEDFETNPRFERVTYSSRNNMQQKRQEDVDILPPSDKESIDLDLEIAKAKLDLAVRDRERNRKLLEQPQQQQNNNNSQRFKVQVDGRLYNTNLPDFWNLEMSPITSTPPRRCRHKKVASSSVPVQVGEMIENSSEVDDNDDDVIHLLNRGDDDAITYRNKISNEKEQLLHEKLNHEVTELEKLQQEIRSLRPHKTNDGQFQNTEEQERIQKNRSNYFQNDDMTIYGHAFNNAGGCSRERQPSNGESKSQNNYMNPSRSCHQQYHQNPAIPPVSRKCAARFDHFNNS